MLLLCGAGLALALLGVALLGARGAAGPSGGLPGLGFVLLLLGYGALAGLAPMHAWLPRAVAAASPPVAAALAGLLAPAALHGILRAAPAVGPASSGVLPPAALLVPVGLATALLAAAAAWRGRPARAAAGEAPGWGAVGLAGLAAVGFGLGGAAGTLAGVLLLLGLPFSVGAAVFGAAAGGPVAAALGRVSLAGMPPFAPFAGLALLFSAVAALPAAAALPLGAALLAAVAARLRALSAPRVAAAPGGLLMAGPAWLSLACALALGAALPEPVAAALVEAARLVR
jgi:hydrogenase-4 component F